MPIAFIDAVQPPMAHYAEAPSVEPAAARTHSAPSGLVDQRARPTPLALALVERAAAALQLEGAFAPTAAHPYRLSSQAFAALKRPAEVERKDPAALAAYHARWDGVEPPTRRELLNRFAEAGAFADVAPTLAEPQVVALFSATVPYTRARVAFLAEQVEAGAVHVGAETKVFLLGGERPLFRDWTEPDAVLRGGPELRREPAWQPPAAWPTTEIAATDMVWRQQLLPAQLRAATVQALATETPATRNRAHGGDVADTLAAQFAQAPRSILLVSSAPFVEHHVLTTRLALQRRGFADVEVAGMGAASPGYWADLSVEQTLGVLFDNLADVFATADELHELREVTQRRELTE